jgi:hypothetical protein
VTRADAHRLAGPLALVLSALACSRASVHAPAPAPADAPALRFPHGELASVRARPELHEELLGTPHRFFRYVNEAFAQRVCDRLAALDVHGPAVNLHGDAHVEQYAVSDEERGLADFDAAAIGPPAVDLVRFAVSLRIVAAARGWSGDGDRLVRAFLDGYEKGLADPTAAVHEPRVAARLRARFVDTPREWLVRTDTMMQRLPKPEFARLLDAKQEYRRRMLAQNPGLSPEFFTPKRAGTLTLGTGSAEEHKYLVRVEGPSRADADDVILEVKEMSDLSGVRCLAGAAGRDPFRVIMGQSRIGAAPSDLLGYLVLDGREFYVQKWRVNYTELRAADLRDAEELVEVAYEVGQQLGRGHPRLMNAPYDVQLRGALLEHLDAVRLLVVQWSSELEQEVDVAWAEFRRASERRYVRAGIRRP